MKLWYGFKKQGWHSLHPTTLDKMFDHNIRFNTLVRNQREEDVLRAWELVYGRRLEIIQFKQLKEGRFLLPIIYTTLDPKHEFIHLHEF